MLLQNAYAELAYAENAYQKQLVILTMTVTSLADMIEAQQLQICAVARQTTCVPVKISRPPTISTVSNQ